MCAKRQDGGNSNLKYCLAAIWFLVTKQKYYAMIRKPIKTHTSKHMPWFIKSAIIFAFYFRKMFNFVPPDFVNSAKITI